MRVTPAFEMSFLLSRNAWIANGACGSCGLLPDQGCGCTQEEKDWVDSEIRRLTLKHLGEVAPTREP